MRLLHTSDWHLGRTLHGADLLAHQAAFLDWLLEQAVSHQVHAVVVAGDIYDRAVPPTGAVAVLDRALSGFAAARIPVLLTSGNHDSAIRLGFGARLSEAAGIHLRTSVADVARPVLVRDEHGEVALYGIGYLLPDAVMDDLGAERSHASVLAAATALIRADAQRRGIARTVVAAHAFVSGAALCESERDIRVGGIGDVPASVFAGISYAALGHLHGQQDVAPGAAGTTVRYSGSPLAFSFSERDHRKSVTLAELGADGAVSITKLAAPVPRPLREVRGRLDDLLAGHGAGKHGAGKHGAAAGGRLPADLADAWVRVVLTDTARPPSPMERLRERWPHTLVLDFEPEGELTAAAADLRRLAGTVDPVRICELFVEFTSGGRASEDQRAVLRDVIEAVQHADAAEGRVWTTAGGAAGQSAVAGAGAGGDEVRDPEDLADAGSVDEWLANAGRDRDRRREAELAHPATHTELPLELPFPDLPGRGGNPAAA